MIAANNHYAGFGPGTVNIIRNMVEPPELSWEDQPQLEKQMRQQKAGKRSTNEYLKLLQKANQKTTNKSHRIYGVKTTGDSTMGMRLSLSSICWWLG
jgi:hypothetical protein